jgi:hypothetical protein
MASQCNRCVGTGKCPACSGTCEAAAREVLTFRGPRLHRFDTPDPQPCGVWRYQALQPAKRKARPMTEGETVAKCESELSNSECAEEKTWPCSAESWRPCDKCHKLVCEKHDYLVPVWPPENGACAPADMICKDCIAALWYRGEISQGTRVQYIY